MRSDLIIYQIVSELHLVQTGDSIYETYYAQNGTFLRLRLSNHGVVLSTWHRHYADNESPVLAQGENLAITILPNKEECEEIGIKYPPKVINKSIVYKDIHTKTIIPYSFKVRHFVYRSWQIDMNKVLSIIMSIKEFIIKGDYCDPLKDTSAKAEEFMVESNKPFKKIK